MAAIGLVLTWWLILLSFVAATISTGKNGFYAQERVGRNGKRFKMLKIRSMKEVPGLDSTTTGSDDPRITGVGRILRKFKLDEFPQLINILLGHMSFVGPRPDVPGFADELTGEDRIILSVRPGITGPATLKYRNEEEILANQPDPEKYNREVIFPDKVALNRGYIENYTLISDLKYILKTFWTIFEG
jgi:lipopolysaccharide/colanic/teichoic acid biosynthesis glycosyltransferase